MEYNSTQNSVLFIVDQLPWPPRNGITLPVYNYLIRINKFFRVKLVFIYQVGFEPSESDLAENEELFGPILCLKVVRKSRFLRLVSELTCESMYQHGWFSPENKKFFSLEKFDFTIVSPISAVAKFNALSCSDDGRFGRLIAAVNDCTASEYFTRPRHCFGGLSSRFKALLDFLRHPLVASIERKLLRRYKYVLLQTAVDLAFMKCLVGSTVCDKVLLCPNGVDESLFLSEPDHDSPSVVFIAELSGEYAEVAEWIVEHVWPRVLALRLDSKLLIVGKNAGPKLKALIASSESVTHINFAPSLNEVYSRSSVAFVPVFKGFGLINKTLEAMAAGLPVVGGEAAFNGIVGFENEIHGVIVHTRNPERAATELARLLNSPSCRKRIGGAGRVLVANQFSWERTVKSIFSGGI